MLHFYLLKILFLYTFLGFEISKQPKKLAFICNQYAHNVRGLVLISSKQLQIFTYRNKIIQCRPQKFATYLLFTEQLFRSRTLKTWKASIWILLLDSWKEVIHIYQSFITFFHWFTIIVLHTPGGGYQKGNYCGSKLFLYQYHLNYWWHCIGDKINCNCNRWDKINVCWFVCISFNSNPIDRVEVNRRLKQKGEE